jgi:hypothetical protein
MESTLTDAEKLDFATTVFTALVGETQDRIKRGLMLRQAMHDAISRGEAPRGYRPAWVVAQSQVLVRFLGQTAQDFNRAHPDDACSVSDLLDILMTTAGLFRRTVTDR